MKLFSKKFYFLCRANIVKANVLGSTVGAVADISAPILAYKYYIIAVLFIIAMITGFIWYKNANFDVEEKAEEILKNEYLTKNSKSTIFFYSFIIFVAISGVLLLQKSTKTQKKGFLSSNIEVFSNIQNAVFSIKNQTNKIAKNTDKMSDDLSAIKEHTKKMANLYTIEEILLLKKTKQWSDILKHMNDIDPRKRDEKWLEILNLAATEHLANLYDLEDDSYKNMEEFKSFLKETPVLRDHAPLMELGAQIMYEWSKQCLEDKNATQRRNMPKMEFDHGTKKFKRVQFKQEKVVDCTKKIDKYLKIFKTNDELIIKIADLYRRFFYPRNAIKYYYKSYKVKMNPSLCQNEGFKTALKGALTINTKYESDNFAKAKELQKNLCPQLVFEK